MIKNKKEYKEYWKLIERLDGIRRYKSLLTKEDNTLISSLEFEIYMHISDYNQKNTEYMGGHQYGVKKDVS